MWVPINSGNRSGSCSGSRGFRIAQVVGCHSENGISYSENRISNSESCSENTPELSESSENGLFPPRAFFLKLGWSPGFRFFDLGKSPGAFQRGTPKQPKKRLRRVAVPLACYRIGFGFLARNRRKKYGKV